MVGGLDGKRMAKVSRLTKQHKRKSAYIYLKEKALDKSEERL